MKPSRSFLLWITFSVSLSDYDRILLDRCLQGAPRAWEDFVDRFLGLMIHVANHTAAGRGMRLEACDRDDLVADIFLSLLENRFSVLRRFRRQCSLATYLAVIARRVVLRRLVTDKRFLEQSFQLDYPHPAVSGRMESSMSRESDNPESRIDDRDHVEQLLMRLDGPEADVVRMYHLEGRSYREISSATGMSENSIGPVLSRARQFLRDNGK